MLSAREKADVAELLDFLWVCDLKSLAITVTNGFLTPRTREEALEAILQFSDTPESILIRKKVFREVLLDYLMKKRLAYSINININDNKATLIQKVLQLWNGPPRQTRRVTRPQKRLANITSGRSTLSGTSLSYQFKRAETYVQDSNPCNALDEDIDVGCSSRTTSYRMHPYLASQTNGRSYKELNDQTVYDAMEKLRELEDISMDLRKYSSVLKPLVFQ